MEDLAELPNCWDSVLNELGKEFLSLGNSMCVHLRKYQLDPAPTTSRTWALVDQAWAS